jgi:hypothetical protein
MDPDPELDVTLSNGRRVVTYQIRSVAPDLWAVAEPGVRRVIRGAAALATREQLDARIAVHLAAGWVPVDAHSTTMPPILATPLSPDLVLQISSLLEALARAGPALRSVDPSGQLWAACSIFRQRAWRFGLGARRGRFARARQERRLGELAEQAGNLPAAILHYRAALASHKGAGVKRQLHRLMRHRP